MARLVSAYRQWLHPKRQRAIRVFAFSLLLIAALLLALEEHEGRLSSASLTACSDGEQCEGVVPRCGDGIVQAKITCNQFDASILSVPAVQEPDARLSQTQSWWSWLRGQIIPIRQSTCIESDGGEDPLKKGYVVTSGKKPTYDRCLDSKTLEEYTCDPADVVRVLQHECSGECIDGACLSGESVEGSTDTQTSSADISVVCVPYPGEECDDGNNEDGDGCSEECRWEDVAKLSPVHSVSLPIPISAPTPVPQPTSIPPQEGSCQPVYHLDSVLDVENHEALQHYGNVDGMKSLTVTACAKRNMESVQSDPYYARMLGKGFVEPSQGPWSYVFDEYTAEDRVSGEIVKHPVLILTKLQDKSDIPLQFIARIEGGQPVSDLQDGWMHYAATYSAREVALYRNGVRYSDSEVQYSPEVAPDRVLHNPHTPLTLGGIANMPDRPAFVSQRYPGELAEIFVYPCVLSDADIMKLSQQCPESLVMSATSSVASSSLASSKPVGRSRLFALSVDPFGTDARLLELDPSTGSTLKSVRTEYKKSISTQAHLAFDGRYVWQLDADGSPLALKKIDFDASEEEARIVQTLYPKVKLLSEHSNARFDFYLGMEAMGDHLYIAYRMIDMTSNEGFYALSIFDPATESVIRTVRLQVDHKGVWSMGADQQRSVLYMGQAIPRGNGESDEDLYAVSPETGAIQKLFFHENFYNTHAALGLAYIDGKLFIADGGPGEAGKAVLTVYAVNGTKLDTLHVGDPAEVQFINALAAGSDIRLPAASSVAIVVPSLVEQSSLPVQVSSSVRSRLSLGLIVSSVASSEQMSSSYVSSIPVLPSSLSSEASSSRSSIVKQIAVQVSSAAPSIPSSSVPSSLASSSEKPRMRELCGNGQFDGDEQCDIGVNYCTASHVCDFATCMCRPRSGVNAIHQTCGNGRFDAGEQCDRSANYCSKGRTCDALSCTCVPTELLPTCGDGVLQIGEQCDGAAGTCPQWRICNPTMCTCVLDEHLSFTSLLEGGGIQRTAAPPMQGGLVAGSLGLGMQAQLNPVPQVSPAPNYRSQTPNTGPGAAAVAIVAGAGAGLSWVRRRRKSSL